MTHPTITPTHTRPFHQKGSSAGPNLLQSRARIDAVRAALGLGEASGDSHSGDAQQLFGVDRDLADLAGFQGGDQQMLGVVHEVDSAHLTSR